MVKHTQTIRRQKSRNCLSVFDHFVGLALRGLSEMLNIIPCECHTSYLMINLLHRHLFRAIRKEGTKVEI